MKHFFGRIAVALSHHVWRKRPIPVLVVLGLLLAADVLCSCEGDQGPAGPPGPGGDDLTITFPNASEVIRADGMATQPISVKITTAAGNNVVGLPVRFVIVSGGGTVSPTEVNTDLSGEASTTYTSGTQPGVVIVAARISSGGRIISKTGLIYVDPLTVSLPLLTSEFDAPLHGTWSRDGTTILFQTEDVSDYRLFRVAAAGGTPQYFGSYRGGVWSPDGSDRIAVFSSANEFFVVDGTGSVIAGPIAPPGYFGTAWTVDWIGDGTRLVATSNTNRYICTLDLTGTGTDIFNGAVSGRWISTIPNTDQVVIVGPSEFQGWSMYAVDVKTQVQTALLVLPDDVPFSGVSVNPGGSLVLFGRVPVSGDDVEDQFDLFDVPVGGGVQQVRFSSPVDELHPQWSPDGTRILFSSNRSGSGYNLYVYDTGAAP